MTIACFCVKINSVIILKNKSSKSVLNLVYIAMFTAVIIICSQIQIPAAVPFTLQTLAIFTAGGILGCKRGFISVLIYVLLGLIGMPVFSGFKGGAGVLFGPTGGYIIGFIFTVLIVGFFADNFGRVVWSLVVSMVLGLLVCYLFGTIWFVIVYNNSISGMSVSSALMMCVVPFLPFDALKILASVILINRLDKVIKL